MKQPHAAPQQVRIIGGRWRRTPLPVLNMPGLRPTPARVRETLFNWLGQDLSGWHCADIFAGTGALGLEAASRGATSVHLFERDRRVFTQLQHMCAKLQAADQQQNRPVALQAQFDLRLADGLVALTQLSAQSLDLVFCDPPFAHAEAVMQALDSALAHALKPAGWLYLELPIQVNVQDWSARQGYRGYQSLKAGLVQAWLCQRLA